MIDANVFRDQPVLTGDLVRLEPLRSHHLDGLLPMFVDPEVRRLTGSQHQVSEERTKEWVATRQDHDDRADWAIVRPGDEMVLGEAVLNEFDPPNAAVNFRIALVGSHLFGWGYGSEATRLVVDYAFDVAGLHRVSLEVYDFNPRAKRVYENCGFVREGRRRDALLWEGQWHDAICMAILSTNPRPHPGGQGRQAHPA